MLPPDANEREQMADIEVYGATWCPDCRRAKKFLTEQRVPFEWFDIEAHPEYVKGVENYPGFPEGVGGAELAERIIEQAKRYGVEMLQAVGVGGIERKEDGVLVVETRSGEHYHGRAVLVSTGSSYRR